jgi:hypothetical protein
MPRYNNVAGLSAFRKGLLSTMLWIKLQSCGVLAKWAPLLSCSGITSVSASPGLCPLDSGTKILSFQAFNILFCRTLRVHCTRPSKSTSAMPLPFSALLGAHEVCGHSPVQTIPKLFEFVLDLQLDDLAVKHVHLFRFAEDCRDTHSLLFLKGSSG